jgi:hypothetical protein
LKHQRKGDVGWVDRERRDKERREDDSSTGSTMTRGASQTLIQLHGRQRERRSD